MPVAKAAKLSYSNVGDIINAIELIVQMSKVSEATGGADGRRHIID